MELLVGSTGERTTPKADDSGNLLVSISGSSTAWNGTDNSADMISLLKAIYAKLDEIATNTAGV